MKVPNLKDLGEPESKTKTFAMTTTIKDKEIKALPDNEEIIIVFFKLNSPEEVLNNLNSCMDENPAKNPPMIKTAMTAEKMVVCCPKVFLKNTKDSRPDPSKVKMNCIPEPVSMDNRFKKIGGKKEDCATWLNSEADSEAKFERKVVNSTKATMIDTKESTTNEFIRETQWIAVFLEGVCLTLPFSSIEEGSMYIFQRSLCSKSGSSRQ